MAPLWIQQIIDDFWTAAGTKEPFPRKLEASVCFALPIGIVKLSNLLISSIKDYLFKCQVPYRMEHADRPLHGCLVAYRGKGLIFIDGTDSDNEQRFTLAHEVSHFLFDYLLPRQKAIKHSGTQITEVLDGMRFPTMEERVDSILSGIPIGVHTHIIDKQKERTICIETNADRLALELIAPVGDVKREIVKLIKYLSTEDSETIIFNTLVEKFGLPDDISYWYSKHLKKRFFKKSVKEWLGI